ncbi:hypothetical protein LY474_33455 [Myxococcus stipitatus]|uniref:hypothetical protein n=1 Tax=Myxococcus stipitatus TaxID=83455 RepID=UPI001F3CBA30|nr:hypothetical protein [Myxococcus stipitatus]MCE9672725.1 hypothetical protein [Myxococcus stipitatus]
MLHSPVNRRAWRTVLVLASSLLAACGGDPPPPTPDPPQVTLLIPEQNVAGTGLKFNVTVTGCDAVSALNIYDRTTFLKTLPYATGTANLELLASDIRYSDPLVGIAASLSLVAEAVCDDGRKGSSLPQAATFFPVSKVVDDPEGINLYSHPLAIDGSGSTISFLSCAKKSRATDLERMYRHGATGGVGTTITVPFPCNASTEITPRHGTTKKRWVWTPDSGAFAIDDTFKVVSQTVSTMKIDSLVVLPDGDALIRTKAMELIRIAHESSGGLGLGEQKWRYVRDTAVAFGMAQPLVTGDNTALVVSQMPFVGNQAQIILEVIDLSTGALRATYTKEDYVGVDAEPPVPVAGFSSDGAVLYLGFVTGSNQSQISACVAVAEGCKGTASKWARSVTGRVTGIIPYAAGSRVAAVATQHVWSLDAATGAVRNREQRSVDANGALHVRQLIVPNQSTDLYFLNAPANTTGQAATLPLEIVAVDQQAGTDGQARELYRYQVPVSMGASLDDSNRLWLRTGVKLVQTQPSTQYRSARPVQ